MAEENLKIGSGLIPVFVDKNGKVVPTTDTLGSGTKPIYLNNGTLTASNTTSGTDTKPLKMVNGSLVPVSSDLATQAWVNSQLSAQTAGYADFKSWKKSQLSTSSAYEGRDCVITIQTIPKDGYVTITIFGNRTANWNYAELQVKDVDGNWINIEGCYGTDWVDDRNAYVSCTFHGYVKANNQFRCVLHGGRDQLNRSNCYIWS